VFLVNSRQGNVRCALNQSKARFREGFLRTYARFFAEFLREASLVRLGTLTPGHLFRFSGTGTLDLTLEAFLGRLFTLVDKAEALSPLLSRGLCGPDLPKPHLLDKRKPNH